MTDVSTRAFRFFEPFEKRGRIDVARLLAGLPVTRAQLEDSRYRVPWDVWAEINDRFGAEMGSPEATEAAGAAVLDPGYLGPLTGIVGLFTEARDLYRVGLRWFAPQSYRNLRFTLEEQKNGPLTVTVEVPDSNRGSVAFMQMTAGGLRAIPRLLGLPDAIVDADITPRRGRFVVTLPQARTARSFLSRAVAVFRGANAVVEELSEQQGRIAEGYAALARAERGFRSVLEALPIAVAVHRRGELRYVNAALARLTGRSVDGLRGMSLVELVHPDDRDALAAWRRRDDASRVVELRLLGPSSPVFVECGEIGGFEFDGAPACLFFAIDLTARIEAQQALERSESVTSVLLRVLPDMLLRVDKRGTLLDYRAGPAHPNVEILAALRGASVFGFVELLPDVSRQLVERGIEKVYEALETGRETAYLVKSSALGPNRVYDCRIFPESQDEVVVLVRDITEQQHMKEQLAIAERMATVGTIAAGVAHELNNPLTYVVGNVSLALEALDAADRGEPLDTASLRQSLEEASLGTERVQRIVKDLGIFARGGSSYELRPTDVRTVVDSVISMTQAETRHRARVTVEHQASVPVHVDPSRLGQVFVNLVVNAAQAIPEGSPATHHIEIVLSVGADGWQEIVVRDDGVGIPREMLEDIFQPFVTTKRGSGGTGLGLAICHRIITELGGRIEVESEPGKGSAFRVRLPPSASGQANDRERPTEEHPGARARILVVDDEPLITRAVTRILSSHDVSTVGSGEDALVRLREQRFDLVLCDLTLGGMNGLDLRDTVRREDPALAERFLFLTGGALTPAARDLVAREPERFVAKPISPVELRERVARELAAAAKG